jgi:predicted ArsR family transcriptional regulator
MKVNSREFITIKEMADRLGIAPNTVKQRLFQHDIKPISKDALYEMTAFETIKNTVMGRPKKENDKQKKPKNK